MEPQQNNHGRRGANAPLREEILSTPALSSAIARWRQGDEVPSTGDTRDRYGPTVALAFPSLKRQEFIDLEEQARKRGFGSWNRR